MITLRHRTRILVPIAVILSLGVAAFAVYRAMRCQRLYRSQKQQTEEHRHAVGDRVRGHQIGYGVAVEVRHGHRPGPVDCGIAMLGTEGTVAVAEENQDLARGAAEDGAGSEVGSGSRSPLGGVGVW